MCHIILLTFVTKYSRVPQDAIKFKRYNAIMETGVEPIEEKGVEIIRQALRKKEKELGIDIFCVAILPDHIHIILDPRKQKAEISKVVNQLKGYMGYAYNRALQGTETGKGKQHSLRAKGYSLTNLVTEDHLHHAIHYVNHNHIKHEERWGAELLINYSDESDKCSRVQ